MTTSLYERSHGGRVTQRGYCEAEGTPPQILSGYCSQTWPDYELFDSCAPVFHFPAVAFPASVSECSAQVAPPPPPTGPCHGLSLGVGLKPWLSFNGSFTAAGPDFRAYCRQAALRPPPEATVPSAPAQHLSEGLSSLTPPGLRPSTGHQSRQGHASITSRASGNKSSAAYVNAPTGTRLSGVRAGRTAWVRMKKRTRRSEEEESHSPPAATNMHLKDDSVALSAVEVVR
ncbi:hypothetical protein EYF80_018037 [Liparis tanakae]|uniref:Uncharacterized protein n=1 Tax=Liparis tanakae TaxID=230148 RepID=A0A4Z2I0W1_9TELE|nr:hypothetical protein EYF80_018037 [Liparis tanakae]